MNFSIKKNTTELIEKGKVNIYYNKKLLVKKRILIDKLLYFIEENNLDYRLRIEEIRNENKFEDDIIYKDTIIVKNDTNLLLLKRKLKIEKIKNKINEGRNFRKVK